MLDEQAVLELTPGFIATDSQEAIALEDSDGGLVVGFDPGQDRCDVHIGTALTIAGRLRRSRLILPCVARFVAEDAASVIDREQ